MTRGNEEPSGFWVISSTMVWKEHDFDVGSFQILTKTSHEWTRANDDGLTPSKLCSSWPNNYWSKLKTAWQQLSIFSQKRRKNGLSFACS